MLQGFRRWKYIYFRPDKDPGAASKNQLLALWQESNLQPCDFGVAQGPVVRRLDERCPPDSDFFNLCKMLEMRLCWGRLVEYCPIVLEYTQAGFLG